MTIKGIKVEFPGLKISVNNDAHIYRVECLPETTEYAQPWTLLKWIDTGSTHPGGWYSIGSFHSYAELAKVFTQAIVRNFPNGNGVTGIDFTFGEFKARVEPFQFYNVDSGFRRVLFLTQPHTTPEIATPYHAYLEMAILSTLELIDITYSLTG